MFFSRKNGFQRVFISLNCGRGSKDYKKIINNLNFVALKLVKKKNLSMHQTHSAKVVEIKKII